MFASQFLHRKAFSRLTGWKQLFAITAANAPSPPVSMFHRNGSSDQ